MPAPARKTPFPLLLWVFRVIGGSGAAIWLAGALTFSPLAAQSNPEEAQQELNKLRAEIADFESKLKAAESQLKHVVGAIETMDQQMTLLRKAVRLLQAQIGRSQQQLAALNREIDTLTVQIKRLRILFQDQVVFSYKYQRRGGLEWLLGAESFNQALVRYKYFQMASEHGRRLYDRLVQKQTRLRQLQAARQQELATQQRLANEKIGEQRALDQKRRSRQQLIEKISRDKSLYEQAINVRKESYRRLQSLIGSLEQQRTGSTPQPNIDWGQVKGNFGEQRRKLNWPVKGRIVQKFGKYNNPRLKTVLVNNGIDIQAAKGTEVHSVFSGVVSAITYISGFGNTLIIDHNNGYYTVYAHLDEVFVKKFQIVDAGTVIGTVGDSGSLEGPRLHFEIYGQNQPQNPVLWLKN